MVTFTDAKRFVEHVGEVTDVVEPDEEMPTWSVSGRTESDCLVLLDEEPESLELNTFFVETPLFPLDDMDDYDTVQSYETDNILVSIQSEDGLFMRARHSTNPELEEMSDAEIISLIFEKDQGVAAQLVYCGQHKNQTDTELKEIVDEMEAHSTELDSVLN